MRSANFTCTILVDQSPKEAFNAILNIAGWWSEEVQGSTKNLNDEFVYRYEDVHYCKLKLVELAPDKRVVWQVLENYFKFTKDKTEWVDTKLVFDISRKGKQTEIRFTHEGLVPAYECYTICEEAWTNYIKGSLRDLITTGKGQPNSKEDDTFHEELAEKFRLQQ